MKGQCPSWEVWSNYTDFSSCIFVLFGISRTCNPIHEVQHGDICCQILYTRLRNDYTVLIMVLSHIGYSIISGHRTPLLN